MGERDYAIKALFVKNKAKIVVMQKKHNAIKVVMKAEYKEKKHVMAMEMNALIEANEAAMSALFDELAEQKADNQNLPPEGQDASKKSIFLILHVSL